MILPDFILYSRTNQYWEYSGIDCINRCLDKKYFKNYPFPITYQYNNRGFRDQEWPTTIDKVQNAIWCVGDSFTVGIGSPVDHTWVNILQTSSNTRCLNLGFDGASNDWIARKVVSILNNVNPKTIIIHWSYLHRREDTDTTKSDEDRRCSDSVNIVDDVENFRKNCLLVETAKGGTEIIHSFIPGAFEIKDSQLNIDWNNIKAPSWPARPTTIVEYNNLPCYIIDELTTRQEMLFRDYVYATHIHNETLSGLTHIHQLDQLDIARDGFHYDILTAQKFVDDVINKLRLYRGI